MEFQLDFLWLGLYQVFAFFINGITGFGCTVLSAPFHSSVLGPQLGTAYATLLTIPVLLYLGIKEIKNVSWKDLIKILILCAPGILVGNFLLASIDVAVAKVAIGTMVTFIAVMNIYKHIILPVVFKKEEVLDAPDTLGKKIFRYACLIVGGIVHGAFTIGGPLITVYTLESVKDKEKFRNTMTWVWIILNIYNAANHIIAGYYTPAMLGASAIGLPLALFGLIMGMKCMSKIDRTTFLRLVYIVLLIIGVDMLIRNVPALFM